MELSEALEQSVAEPTNDNGHHVVFLPVLVFSRSLVLVPVLVLVPSASVSALPSALSSPVLVASR